MTIWPLRPNCSRCWHQARRAQELATLIGTDALSITEQRYLALAHHFESEFIDQEPHQSQRSDRHSRPWRGPRLRPSPPESSPWSTPEQIDASSSHHTRIHPPGEAPS